MNALKPFFRELSAVWIRSRTPHLAAALAYYSLFSLAPMLFIASWVASLFLSDLSHTSQLYSRLEAVLGAETAGLLRNAVSSISESSSGNATLVTIIGIGVLLYAATGVFASLRDSINTVWEIPLPTTNALWQILKGRLLAFALVLCAGFVFVAAAIANLLIRLIASLFPFELSLNLINNLVVFILAVLSIATLYKILPDTHVKWRDVWIGAVVSSALIMIGSQLLGLYLSYSNLGSAFGAAGALVVLLVGVYIMTQMFLFGAVITRVYTQFFGSMRQDPQMTTKDD